MFKISSMDVDSVPPRSLPEGKYSYAESLMSSTMEIHDRGEIDDIEEEFIRACIDDSKLLPLGRLFSTVLSAKLQDLGSPNSGNGLVNSSLVSLQQHIEVAQQKKISLNRFFLPLLEHAVKSKHRNNRKQVVAILEWLLNRKSVCTSISEGLVRVLRSKEVDHKIKLGWCVVVHYLLQQRLQSKQSARFPDMSLKPFMNCIPDLLNIMSDSSSQGVPTRLSVMAADCFILICKYVEGECAKLPTREGTEGPIQIKEQDLSIHENLDSSIRALDSSPTAHEATTSGRTTLGKEYPLWEQLDILLQFVLKLKKWNECSRPLYAKGLHQIIRSLEKLVQIRDAVNSQGGGLEDLMVLQTVLSSYWDRYCALMLMDSSITGMDSKGMLQQWIEGLQHNLQRQHLEEDSSSDRSGKEADEICVFFLSCMALLLGRLNAVETKDLVGEYGSMLLLTLFGQLRGKHMDAVDLAVGILRTFLFQTDFLTIMKMGTVAHLLIDLLDKCDSTSTAVVALIADYFAVNPCAPEIEKLFGILDSDNSAQRQNAIAVISEILNTLSSSENDIANTVRQNIAIHLLKRLGDVELENRIEVSRIFGKLDPTFVLPDLVQKVYSRDEKVRSTASSSIVSILKGQSNSFTVLSVLLDCTSNVIGKKISPAHPGDIFVSNSEQSLADADRIMRLIPSWASEVKEWDILIGLILEKMFAEPSNPIMPRFLSQISKHLLDNAQVVFKHLFIFMFGKSKISEDLTDCNVTHEPQVRLGSSIFQRLSPLLVLKVLPLAAFDELSCKELYGKSEDLDQSCIEDLCIVGFLIGRACGEFEAYEVRKLSAELLGRCIPNVILPVLLNRLQNAVENKAMLELKSYLFTLCNLISLRRKSVLDHPCILHIQGLLCEVLLWPCSSTDEDIFKAQHGCIDCFALMVLEELEIDECIQKRSKFIKEIQEGDVKQQSSILCRIVTTVIGQSQTIPFLSDIRTDSPRIMLTSVAFRICMANVLIRAAQKVTLKHRVFFVSCVVSPVLHFLEVGQDIDMKPACLQILFSIVHNLKEGVKSYAVDSFNLSLKIIRSNAPTEERLGAARLLASLLTSADDVITEVSPFLSEALAVLEGISRMDSSVDMRIFCEKLVECMTTDTAIQSY